MKAGSARSTFFRIRATVAAVACCFAPFGALANPTGPTVVNGQAGFAQQAGTLTVTNTPGAIINWQSFSIGTGEVTRFVQQNAASAVLNRVVGSDVSSILGTLQSNGRVFLINPQGIVIGPGAVIDVAGLVASSLNLSNADFLAGRMRFEAAPIAGPVTNAGEIRTPTGGRVLLAAPEQVENTGIIRSPKGEVLLAAGRSVELVDSGSPDVRVEVTAPTGSAVNLGEIVAESGTVGIYAGLIRQGGTLSADSAVVGANGRIVLRATRSVELSPGSTTTASGAAAGTVAIAATGESVDAPGVVYQRGDVRADGGSRGGTVTIRAADVLSTAEVSADGQVDGGQVLVSADDRVLATASSRLSARGGTGAGGEVDVRAGAGLFTSGTVDVSGGSVGGVARLLGKDVKLAAARVAADGALAGGAVKIGGGFQGKEPLPNATDTTVGEGTRITANATANGKGGRVVVWADGDTRYAGEIEARGGPAGGNGGEVEVSGKGTLAFDGEVRVDAPKGNGGSLLLDPQYIVIVPSGGAVLGVELLDPNPTAGAGFGSAVTTLSNGNFLVRDPNDSFGAAATGAVYVFDGTTGALLGAIQGTTANEMLGTSVNTSASFGNANFLILSPNAANGGLAAAGAAILGSGATGNEIGRISGNAANEALGTNGFQFVSGNNYLLISPDANGVGGAARAGAIILANRTTGTEIGRLSGAAVDERLGQLGITSLGTRYIARSPDANGAGGVAQGGAVIMASTTTGLELGRTQGVTAGERLGDDFPHFLGNGNYVIVSPNRTVGGNANAGAVVLASGTNGTELGKVEGNAVDERIGEYGIITFFFNNDNYLIQSPDANGPGAVANAGAVIMASGTTGNEIGRVSGASAGERLGQHYPNMLYNGNYVITSPQRTVGPNAFAGAVVLADGTTGNQLGQIEGGAANEFLGDYGIDYLWNSDNYVIRSPDANGALGVARGGAVITADATTGLELNRLQGNATNESLGSIGPEFIGNGNFIVRSANHTNAGGDLLAGVVMLADGSTGALLGKVEGNAPSERLGNLSPLTYQFNNDNYVLRSPDANGAGAVSTGGAVILVDGTTGLELGRVSGASAGERLGNLTLSFLGNGNYVIRSPNRTVASNANAGAVVVASGADGSELGAVQGNAAGEFLGNQALLFSFDGDIIIRSPDASTLDLGTAQAGAVIMASATTGMELGRVEGTSPGERLGSLTPTFLNNGNYVVRSPNRGVGIDPLVGAVILADRHSGDQLGVVEGNAANEQFGSLGITEVGFAGDFIVRSPNANGAGAVAQGGAVVMISGTTGSELGRVEGVSASERLGNLAPTFLGNDNYVIRSPDRMVGPNALAGAVILADGSTGNEIGSVEGEAANERLGSNTLFTDFRLGDNYIVRSPDANGAGAVAQGGAMIQVSGTTGLELGRVEGTSAGERLGTLTPSFISNNNYVVRSLDRTVGGNALAGAVILADNATGNEIGRVEGNAANERLGNFGITSLSSGNYMIRSPDAAGAGSVAAGGAVIVASGVTGVELGRVSGASANERLGSISPTFLGTGNYVIRSTLADAGGNADVGAVILASGVNGIEIGRVTGNAAGEQFGSLGITTSFNLGSNYYVRSPDAHGVGGVANGGTVVLVNGTTGTEIGRTSGTSAGERFGNLSPTFIGTNYLVRTPLRDASGLADVGAVVLVSSTTGTEIGRVTGNAAGEQLGNLSITFPSNPEFFIIRSPNATANGQAQAGAVITASRTTGMEVGRATGLFANDHFGNQSPDFFSTGDFLVRNPDANIGPLTQAGAVVLVSGTTGMEIARLTGNTANERLGDNVTFLHGDRRLVRSTLGSVDGLAAAGRVFVVGPGLLGAGSIAQSLLFATAPGGLATITSAAIVNALMAGTDLLLQANTDITLSEGAAIEAPTGTGTLTLQAGRSVLLNSSILTANEVTLIGNESGDGLVPEFREPGTGGIVFAPGVSIGNGTSSLANRGVTAVTLTPGSLGGLTSDGLGEVVLEGGRVVARVGVGIAQEVVNAVANISGEVNKAGEVSEESDEEKKAKEAELRKRQEEEDKRSGNRPTCS